MSTRFSHAIGVALLIATALLGASGGAQAAPRADTLPPEMLGKPWALVSLQTAPGTVEDVKGKGLTIEFSADGKLSGSGGCNNYFGDYTAGPGQALKFGPLGSTQKACEQPVMDLETKYFAALGKVTSYKLDGSARLQLNFDNDQGVLGYVTVASGGLPTTGSADDLPVGLSVLAVLCLAAGVWLLRARGRSLAYAANPRRRR